MLNRLATAMLLAATPIHAETDPQSVRGNWGDGADQAGYQAILTPEGDFLRLQVFAVAQDGTVDAQPLVDNPAILDRSSRPGARAWLAPSPDGTLAVNTVMINDSYTYSDRLTLALVEGQVTVIRQDMFNVYPVGGQPASDPFSCDGGCYACQADLRAGTVQDGLNTLPIPPLAALDAATWGPEQIYDLGFCPRPD